MAVNVTKQTAVTAAAFRHENTGRENTGRVELNGFHVAERGNTGSKAERARAFADLSVRRHAEELAGAASGNGRSLCNVGNQFARHQIAADSAVAALAVMNQRESFDTFDNRNVFGDDAVAHGVKHRVARAVRHKARTPLLRARRSHASRSGPRLPCVR